MPEPKEFFVYVTKTERANFRYRVEAATAEAAIEAAREQCENGDPGTWVDTIDGLDAWSQADTEEVT